MSHTGKTQLSASRPETDSPDRPPAGSGCRGVCPRCGGTIHGAKCLLCELFAQGPGYAGVETERHNKPKKSDALAVHPKQVPEAIEDARRKGVPTDFLPDGRPLIRSRAHQKAYLKAYGMKNRDGGYGD